MKRSRQLRWSKKIIVSLIASAACGLYFCGCNSESTWRADGIGLSLSPSSVSIIYGEIDRVPPGGYYKRERTVDLRPMWQTWFVAPDTNCLATSVVILDATRAIGSVSNVVTIASDAE